MSGAIEKSLAILEAMALQPGGVQVSAIAARLEQPVSGVHRQLREFERLGYVRQIRDQGDYALTIKLAAIGLSFLSRAGVNDVAQPILDRLARRTGELIRLSVMDGDDLVWVAVAQGATGGLRYDPGSEQGVVVHLASTAGGQAYLATLADEEALMRVGRQGVLRRDVAPAARAPRTGSQVLEMLRETRRRGFSLAIDTYLDGMAAMAVPVFYRGSGTVLGCVSVAGPSVRLRPDGLSATAAALREAAGDLGAAADASQYFAELRRRIEAAHAEPAE